MTMVVSVKKPSVVSEAEKSMATDCKRLAKARCSRVSKVVNYAKREAYPCTILNTPQPILGLS
jgi:hypothetical protein